MDQPSPLMTHAVRARVRRARAAAEDEAHEGGELNLVPYLDILVNTIIFLLATTVSAMPLAHIRTSAPHHVDPDARSRPALPGHGLLLTVAIAHTGFIVADAGGVQRRIPLRRGTRLHDFEALTRQARQIKRRHPDERQVVLSPNPGMSYHTVVHTMDALRGRSNRRCTGADGCLFDRPILAAGVR